MNFEYRIDLFTKGLAWNYLLSVLNNTVELEDSHVSIDEDITRFSLELPTPDVYDFTRAFPSTDRGDLEDFYEDHLKNSMGMQEYDFLSREQLGRVHIAWHLSREVPLIVFEIMRKLKVLSKNERA